MIGGALLSVSMAKPAAVLYRLMNASRSVSGNDVVDVVEHAAAALIEQIEQAKRPGPAIPQDHRRDLGAQSRVVRLQRRRSTPCSRMAAPSTRASITA
jgi:hypothetical protein